MNHKINLDQIQIAAPCLARWEDMQGNDRVRFCGHCGKNVYNFSKLARAEVEHVLREKEGKLCGRFYRRADGRMLTADCPSESRKQRDRLARLCTAVIAFFWFLASGCARNPALGRIYPKVTPLPNAQPKLAATVGAICLPPISSNQLDPSHPGK